MIDDTGKRVPPYYRDDHRWMILHQDEWPLWPKLPLKRPYTTGIVGSTLGFIIGTAIDSEINPNSPIRVYLGLLLPRSFVVEDHHMYLDYDNLDCLLDAGWVVD